MYNYIIYSENRYSPLTIGILFVMDKRGEGLKPPYKYFRSRPVLA